MSSMAVVQQISLFMSASLAGVVPGADGGGGGVAAPGGEVPFVDNLGSTKPLIF